LHLFAILANKAGVNLSIYCFDGIERVKRVSIRGKTSQGRQVRLNQVCNPSTARELNGALDQLDLPSPISRPGAISLHLFTLNFIENVALLHLGNFWSGGLALGESQSLADFSQRRCSHLDKTLNRLVTCLPNAINYIIFFDNVIRCIAYRRVKRQAKEDGFAEQNMKYNIKVVKE